MSIMMRITRDIPLYSIIKTPSGSSEFKINHKDSFGVVILVGKKGNRMTLPSSVFDDAPNFLRGKDWIEIGARHDVADVETFEEYVQSHTHGQSGASYVAPILEEIGIVEIDRKRPARIRLRETKAS